MPAVSVLMPCYNAARTLPEALDSLSTQTFSNFEVIAVDDGSTDATQQILQEWGDRDKRLHVISRPHAGLIVALNAGLDACQAPYVARMDADDWSHSERLSRQVAYLEAHPEASVVSCLVAGFPEGQVRQGFRIYIDWLNSLSSDEDIRREIFVESPLPHPSVTFRRQVIILAGGYQERGWAEDYDLWLRLYLAGVRFAKLPEILLGWREYSERLTRTDGRYSMENFLRAKAFYLARGTLVEVHHLAPTPTGATVHVQCEVIEVDGRRVTFDVQAWDENGKIGEGRHQRTVIDLMRFLQRLHSR